MSELDEVLEQTRRALADAKAQLDEAHGHRVRRLAQELAPLQAELADLRRTLEAREQDLARLRAERDQKRAALEA